MVNICIIALVGLPASGKTTFCKTLLNSAFEYAFIHVCYDEIFNFIPQSSEITFKEQRKTVLLNIQLTIDSIKNEVERSTFKDCIILCDDNNYYAGMRYEIFKICRKNQVSFGEIHFPIDLDTALTRNSMRESSLPVSVIERMNNRLEVPSPKNQWEKYTYTIQDKFKLEELCSFFARCLQNPLINTCKEDHSCNRTSTIHEIDILLRKHIKDLLQTTEGDLSKRAKVLNERRKCILLNLKKRDDFEGELDVDSILQKLLLDSI